MSSEEDAAWLDALAGRGAPAIAPGGSRPTGAAVQEGLALREYLKTLEFDMDSAVPRIDSSRERELLTRARAAGLLGQGSLLRPLRGRWFALRAGSAAAAVIVVAVGIGLYRHSVEPREALRGVENGTVHLDSGDPPGLKRRLTQELGAAGVAVAGYQRLGHLGIDADLPQPLPLPVRRILERHHIPIPADGALVVEIEKPGSP